MQETLLRAWRSFDGFEGRAALRSWLYRIATNVCLDMLNQSRRRARPMDLGPSQAAEAELWGTRYRRPRGSSRSPTRVSCRWVGTPAELAELRDSIHLAFVAALQHLPPRQRAVLILREVLRWKASEVAELLDTTVASVNSALQRARSTLGSSGSSTIEASQPMDDAQRDLLARYVDAFERYDLDSLTSLLHEDATWSMPPYELWLRGHPDIRRWCLGPGIGCRDSRLVPVVANGSPAFAQYKPDPGGGYAAWALQVLEMSAARITGVCFFLNHER